MSTDVVAYSSASLNDRIHYANTLAAAGQLIPKGLMDPKTGQPSAPKILLVMETGAMLGLHPMAALQSIDVVEGRATLSARLIAALIRKAGNRLEIKKSGSIPTGDYSVTVVGTITETGESFDSTWDIPRAIRAGLVNSYEPNAQGVWEVRARSEKGNPKPWETYAEVMPVWRAIGEVSRFGFSDVTLGMYATEELTDGGIPIQADEPDPVSTEPWEDLIAAATSRAALDEIATRIREKGESTDKLRAKWLARAGVLDREPVDAEIVDDAATEAGNDRDVALFGPEEPSPVKPAEQYEHDAPDDESPESADPAAPSAEEWERIRAEQAVTD